jgi:hypothetical protein
MGQVQTFLTIGASVLFSILILNSNHLIAISKEQEIKAEYIVISTFLAKSLADEIASKAFDQNTINNPELTDISILSSTMGADAGEYYPYYNDFDDYNNYTKIDSSTGRGVFTLSSNVTFVDEYYFDTPTANKTRTKRLFITVSNTFTNDLVKIYSYKSY